MQILPLPVRVEPSSVEFVTVPILPFTLRKIQIGPVARRLVRSNAAATQFRDQQPADCKCIVTHQLRIESEGRLACQQSVVRVVLSKRVCSM